MWYFAVLALMPPAIENVVMVFGPLLAGLLLLSLPFVSGTGERSWKRRPWAVASVLGGAVLIGVLWLAAVEHRWSPHFTEDPLPVEVVGATEGPVAEGAKIFHDRGCINCHRIEGHGGFRGPELTYVADKLGDSQLILRIANGGGAMPAFASIIHADEMAKLIAFLDTRKHEVKN